MWFKQKEKGEHKYSRELYLEPGTPDNFIISRVTEGARVLELGPSMGYMTKYLTKELNATVDVIEFDIKLYEKVKDVANLAFNYNLNEIENWINTLDDNTYDHIIAQDVLEHTLIPIDIMHLLETKLKRNGTFLITYPNFSHSNVLMEMYNGTFRYYNWGLLDETHYQFFNSDKLLEYILEIGYKLKDYNVGYCLPQDMIKFNRSYMEVPLPVRDIIINKKNAHVATLFYEISKYESDHPHNPAYFDFYNPGYDEFRYSTTVVKNWYNLKDTEPDQVVHTYRELHFDEEIGTLEFEIRSKTPIISVLPSIRMRDYKLSIYSIDRKGNEITELYNDVYRNVDDIEFTIQPSKAIKVKMEYDVKL